MAANPPRWHPDPTGRHELRYWDGRAWTAHVSDRGVAGSDRLADSPTGAVAADAQIMPSSEGRSTPSTHEPMRVTSVEPSRPSSTRSRPRPIVTEAGWSSRTKLLVGFIAIDAIVALAVIFFVTR